MKRHINLKYPQYVALDPNERVLLYDRCFNSGSGFNSAIAWSFLESSNTKIICLGRFTSYNNNSTAYGIVRLNLDGTIDNTLNPGTGFNINASAVAADIGTDEKIVMHGTSITSYDGNSVNGFLRINADGSYDNTFTGGRFLSNLGSDAIINILKLQSDGKIICVGNFATYSGISINKVARINTDGSLDTSFNSGYETNSSTIGGLEIQSDGKLLLASGTNGLIYSGVTTNRLIRTDSNGYLDTTFSTGTGPNNLANRIKQLSDGKILITGPNITSYNGNTISRLCRINTDGSFDNTFIATGLPATSSVFVMVEMPGNNYIIGGNFATYSGVTAGDIIYLDVNGYKNNIFQPGAGFNLGSSNTSCSRILLTAENNYICTGTFYSYDNILANHITKISLSGELEQCERLVPSPSPTPSMSRTPTPTRSITPSNTPSISITPTMSLTPTPTPTPSSLPGYVKLTYVATDNSSSNNTYLVDNPYFYVSYNGGTLEFPTDITFSASENTSHTFSAFNILNNLGFTVNRHITCTDSNANTKLVSYTVQYYLNDNLIDTDSATPNQDLIEGTTRTHSESITSVSMTNGDVLEIKWTDTITLD